MKRIFAKIFSAIWKILKSKIFIRIIESIFIGLVAGLLVTHLISGPNFSILNMTCDKKENSVDIEVSFQNTGESPATFVRTNHFWIVGNKSVSTRLKAPVETDRVETGDIFFITIKDIKHNNNYVILHVRIDYSDTSKLRKYFNQLIGKSYTKTKWARYNPTRDKVERLPLDELSKMAKKVASIYDKPELFQGRNRFIVE